MIHTAPLISGVWNRTSVNRRRFLKGLGITTIASLSGIESQCAAPDAKPDHLPAIGIIGLGKQGQFLTIRFPELARVTALSDVHQARLKSALPTVKGPKPRRFADYRELLALPDLDGVAVATPDHWHALITIEALAMGRHVYLEPPVCRTLAECRAMIRAETKSGKVVQVAHLARANAAADAVRGFIKNGRLGRVGSIELWSNPGPGAADCVGEEKPPKDLNWPLWLGPVGKMAFCKPLFEGAWRHAPNLGGGWYRERISAQLALLPWLTGISLTGRWRVRPLAKSANDAHVLPQSLIFESPEKTPSIMWQFTEDKTHSLGWGMNIIGSEDSVWMAGGDAHCAAETKVFQEKPNPRPRDDFDPNHRGNWVAAMKGERRVTMPLKTAVAGLALAIAGQTAWKLGRETSIDLTTLTLGDEEARAAEVVEYAAPWKLPEEI